MLGKQAVLNFVKEIGAPYLSRGFVSTQKGLILKYRVEAEAFDFVIKFHIIQSEVKEGFELSCVIMVLSEQLRIWRLQKYRSKDLAVDTVFTANIKDIIPKIPNKVIGEISLKHIEEQRMWYSELLALYIDPIFEYFRDKEVLIQHTVENGWRFNESMSSENFVYPIDFMTCFASYEDNCKGFNNYLKREGLVGQAKRIYKEMYSPKYKGFIQSDALVDKVFQLAFIHKIPIVS